MTDNEKLAGDIKGFAGVVNRRIYYIQLQTAALHRPDDLSEEDWAEMVEEQNAEARKVAIALQGLALMLAYRLDEQGYAAESIAVTELEIIFTLMIEDLPSLRLRWAHVLAQLTRVLHRIESPRHTRPVSGVDDWTCKVIDLRVIASGDARVPLSTSKFPKARGDAGIDGKVKNADYSKDEAKKFAKHRAENAQDINERKRWKEALASGQPFALLAAVIRMETAEKR